MKTLFAKIFLWFFATQVLIGFAMFAVGFSGRDSNALAPAPVRQAMADELRFASESAVLLARSGQLQQLAESSAARGSRARILWRTRDGQVQVVGNRPLFAPERQLARTAFGSSEFVWSQSDDFWGGALSAPVGNGDTIVVVRFRPRRFQNSPWGFLSDLERPNGRLRFCVAVGLMALVCFGLARYLTLPIERVRAATRRLQEGDLTARVGFKTRGDEIVSLGHDFDAMAARLEESAATERRLLGDISHELRSPLARLSVALDIIEQSRDRAQRIGEVLPEAKYISTLERIRRESGVLNELIGQLLELSRLEALARDGSATPAFEHLRLEHIVDDIVEDAQFEARSHGRDVELVANERCDLTGAAPLLRSAIENVVRNAVRYTREKSSVEVALRHVEDEAILTVRDYGPGVPEESLESLFRPFYRVDTGRDRDRGGVGLGLSIAQRALRVHGATIEAHNVEGGGLLVEMRIPLERQVAKTMELVG